jgi:hypothetical protein
MSKIEDMDPKLDEYQIIFRVEGLRDKWRRRQAALLRAANKRAKDGRKSEAERHGALANLYREFADEIDIALGDVSAADI